VLTDPELSERQKQMLIEIYDSFRTETALAAQNAAQDPAGADGSAETEEDTQAVRAGIDPAALAWPEEPTEWQPEEPTEWQPEDLDGQGPIAAEPAGLASPEPSSDDSPQVAGDAAAGNQGQGGAQADPNVTAEPDPGPAETR
jgi:hypothetical protein